MRFAVISDVHSNLAALDAVIEDAARHKIAPGQVWCPGDAIGYGPFPCECLTRLKEWVQPNAWVAGNHDAAIVGRDPEWTIGARDAPAPVDSDWWRKCGLHGYFSHPGLVAARLNRDLLSGNHCGNSSANTHSADWLEFLSQLPRVARLSDQVLLTHGGLRKDQPTATYVFPFPTTYDGEQEFDRLAHWADHQATTQSYGATVPDLVIMGHTHYPAFFVWHDNITTIETITWNQSQTLNRRGKRIILNPGSVGQPRDGNPAAAYLILDLGNDTVEFRRVPYPIKETQRRMEKLGFGHNLIDRLKDGR